MHRRHPAGRARWVSLLARIMRLMVRRLSSESSPSRRGLSPTAASSIVMDMSSWCLCAARRAQVPATQRTRQQLWERPQPGHVGGAAAWVRVAGSKAGQGAPVSPANAGVGQEVLEAVREGTCASRVSAEMHRDLTAPPRLPAQAQGQGSVRCAHRGPGRGSALQHSPAHASAQVSIASTGAARPGPGAHTCHLQAGQVPGPQVQLRLLQRVQARPRRLHAQV